MLQPVFAGEPAPRPTLVLAFNPMAPLKIIDAQGTPSGPYFDIVSRLAEHAGMKLSVRPCPLLRCLELLKQGDADLGIGILPSVDRDSFLDYLNPPFAVAGQVCFFRRRNDASTRISRYQDLRSLRIGITAGAHYFPRFDGDDQLNKDSAPDKVSNLRKLLAHRVDAVIMVCDEGQALLDQPEFYGRVVREGEPVMTGPRRIALARHSRLYGQKARLEQELRRMMTTGEIRRLLGNTNP